MPARSRLLSTLCILTLFVACKADPPPANGSTTSSSGSGTTTTQTEARYLALGDSFTIGTGSTPSESFPARLTDRWKTSEKERVITLKNLGVNGYTTDDLTARELPEVRPFKPTFVTLAIGANDRVRGISAEVYRTHIQAILKAIIDAGVEPKRIVTLPQPDWSLSPVAADFGDPKQLGADIVAFNQILHDESDKVGAKYIDLFPLMRKQADAKMLAPDGLHPNAKSHDEWAAAIFEQIPHPP